VEFIEGYNDWSIRFKKLKEYAKKEGAPKSFLDDIDQIETPIYAGKISKPDVLLEEGNIKNVNRNIEIIFTPGHDRTEISILDNPSQILFSGDHILPKITPFIPLEDAGDDMLEKYTSSLDKVYNLEQKLIAPGHGDLIEKPYSRIEQMQLHHKKRSDKIIDLIGNSKFSGWEIVNLLFPRKLDELNLRLAFQETMAHLIYLENKGLIKHVLNSDTNYWEKVRQV
jgi:glyoxylase-like metal-dependent hydrolase (beta-lactamase superfamily II)